MTTFSSASVVTAYRSLYRSGLRAVKYSRPARYVMRDVLRKAFREGSPADFNVTKIQNTVTFLQNAVTTRGIEHKVLQNILRYRWWEKPASELK